MGPCSEGISESYKWILPDLPGSGRQPERIPLDQLKDFAEIGQAITDQEKIRELVLIGHSMGGYISLAFAEKYPENVPALGLFHSSSYADSAEKKESREKNIRFIQNHGAAPFVQQAIPGLFSAIISNRSIRRKSENWLTGMPTLHPNSLVQYLEAMKQRPATTGGTPIDSKPVLFIMGEEDRAIPLKDALEQCHLPRISYIHILTHSAHMGMIEETSLCNSILDRFLEQISD